MKWYTWEVCSVEMEDTRWMEWRIVAGNMFNGVLAVLMRRRNVSTAARLAVHNAVLVPTLLYGIETWVLQRRMKER